MKSFIHWLKSTRFWKWGQSRSHEQTGWWSAYLITAGIITFIQPIMGAAVFLIVLLFLIAAVLGYKKPLTLLLITALLFSQAPKRSEAKAEVVQCNAVIIGGLVIVVGGLVIYKVIKFCKKHFPPPPPPPGTNNPPATNAPPDDAALHLPNLSPSQPPEGCDISSLGWMDTSNPANPVPFQDFFTVSFKTSTNLTDWTNAYTVNLWLSSNSAVTVLYDAASNALATNWTAGNPYTQSLTNYLPCKLTPQPQLFIRDW